MKSYYFGVFLCCMLSTGVSFSQSGEASVIELTAVRLEQQLISAYLKLSPNEAFTVNAKGVLRPQKSYRMYYLKLNRKVIIFQGNKDEIRAYNGGYEEVPLPDGNGVVACGCPDSKSGDDCRFVPTDENGPDRDDFACEGKCGCGLWIMMEPDQGIADYETPGGGWFNF